MDHHGLHRVTARGVAAVALALVLLPAGAYAQDASQGPSAVTAAPPSAVPVQQPAVPAPLGTPTSAAAHPEAPPPTPETLVPPVPPPDVTLPDPAVTPPPSPTQQEHHDFIDTRITWTFGDDDVLSPTGARVPVSPLPRIGDRPQYQLFFDALNSRYAGRENLTHLAMYAHAPGFIPRVDTEAALILRFDLGQLATNSGALNQALYDAGTFIRVAYHLNTGRPNDTLSVTFFPFDTDRFRIGNLWDVSWGGNDIFPRRNGPAPGAKVSLDVGRLSLWAGFKTTGIVVPLEVITASQDIEVVRVDETQYGLLGGLGYRVNDVFRFDMSGGWFQQGLFDFPGVRGQQVYLFGGSARLLFSRGIATPTSLDMRLYRNDPFVPFQAFVPETYTPGRILWSVAIEGSAMDQNLANIDVPGATSMQPGFAGSFEARLKAGYFGTSLTAVMHTVPFLLMNVPSFIPFQSLPIGSQVSPETIFAASVDYAFTSLHLVPSFIAGVQLPATFSASVTEGSLQSLRTLVIRAAGNFSILPPGASATPIISARTSLRWDISSIIAGIFWIQYVRDENSTLLQVDPSGTRQVRIYQAADQLGFGVTAQARF